MELAFEFLGSLFWPGESRQWLRISNRPEIRLERSVLEDANSALLEIAYLVKRYLQGVPEPRKPKKNSQHTISP